MCDVQRAVLGVDDPKIRRESPQGEMDKSRNAHTRCTHAQDPCGWGAQSYFTLVTNGFQEETVLKLNLHRQRALCLNKEGNKGIGARETTKRRGH